MKKSIKCDSFVFEHLFYDYISYDYIIVTNGEFCGKIKNGKFYFKHIELFLVKEMLFTNFSLHIVFVHLVPM